VAKHSKHSFPINSGEEGQNVGRVEFLWKQEEKSSGIVKVFEEDL
jgi:hypothetical protein